jgi:hypothetical protein
MGFSSFVGTLPGVIADSRPIAPLDSEPAKTDASVRGEDRDSAAGTALQRGTRDDRAVPASTHRARVGATTEETDRGALRR